MGLFDKLKGKKEDSTGALLAVFTGTVVPLDQVPDEVFAQKMLGDGAAVLPEENTVYSPVSGIVSEIFDTLHAYAITSLDGLEILVHIGVNTVELNGEGFQALVKKGDKVKAGQPIAEADLALLQSKGYETCTPIIITNSDEVSEVTPVSGPAKGGETIAVTYKK